MRIPHWGHLCTTGETNRFATTVGLRFASLIEDEGTRQSISSFLERGDFPAVCNFPVDYTTLTLADAGYLRQVLSLFSKRIDLDLGIDKELAGWEKFQEAEESCEKTNGMFKAWASGRFQFQPDVESALFAAQRKIARVLGDVPRLDQLRFKFGPGATTQIKRMEANARRKLGTGFACSEDLAPYVRYVLEEVPAWIPFEPESETATVTCQIHDGRLNFVPKDAKTYRAVVVEPVLNSFVQLGIGDYIARRLRHVGIDIRDQTRNKSLAELGSRSGALATLDLSSASDTIADELVAHLLPYDWYEFLSACRTGHVEYKGRRMKLAKFSSMGNGFTFPLETLIFWALAESCVASDKRQNVSVYGDDIIIPTENYAMLSKVLTVCGFTVNTKKSFASGPFRESCGGDYFLGIDIRPFYLKDRISGESLFTMHNYFVRKGDLDTANFLQSFVDPSMKIFGPDGYGDGHLIGQWQAVPHRRSLHPDERKSSAWGGFTFETFQWRARVDRKAGSGDHVFPSYTAYTKEGLPRLSDAKSLEDFLRLEDRPTRLHSDGTPICSLPGVQTYRRIKIYTLDPDGVSHLLM